MRKVHLKKLGGLLETLFICKGCRVMLTNNLNVKFGLFNGSMGTVVDIVYPFDQIPKDCQPSVVTVQFDRYTGPPFIKDNPKLVTILPLERRIDCSCYSCKRKQIPLRLGWDTTIHRCQGMTIGKGESKRYIVINPGTRKFESINPGTLFVALSRAKTAGGAGEDPDFAWHPSILINEDRLCHKPNTPTTRSRFTEIERIKHLAAETKTKFQNIENLPSLKHIYFKIDNFPEI